MIQRPDSNLIFSAICMLVCSVLCVLVGILDNTQQLFSFAIVLQIASLFSVAIYIILYFIWRRFVIGVKYG